MADTEPARTQHLQHDEILEAVAFAAERFLRASDWLEAAQDVLGRLGAAAGAGRAYVARADRDERGAVQDSTWVAEWCAPGIAPLLHDSVTASAPWFPRWRDLLAAGEAVQGDVVGFPDDERAVLSSHGVASVLALPVVVHDRWWGSIGLDDERQDRGWHGPALDALRTAAQLLSAAIERQQHDERLGDAEERYRRLVERIPAVTYTDVPDDGEVRMGFVSPQIQDVLGYPPQAFVDDPGLWKRLIHPDDRSHLETINAFDIEDTAPFDHEYRMIAASGLEVWVHDTSLPVFGEDDRIESFQGFMLDITQRKEAEDRLRRAQARLQALIENVPAVVYTQAIGGEQGEFWISPRSEAIFGYTLEEWSEAQGFWEDHLHPDDRERVLALDATTDASLAPFSHEYRFQRADGSYAWVLDEAVFVPKITEDGRGVWQGLLFDVTERKEAEHQLMEAERVLRATVEHLPAIVYRESPEQDRSKLYLSPQVEAVTGWTREEWASIPGFWVNHLHPDDRASVLDANASADRTRQRFAVDYRFQRKDGEWVWLHDEATFVGGGDDEAFWQGFMFDVTERKLAEQHLRETEEKFRTIVEQNQAIFYIQEIDPGNPAVSLTTYIAPGNTDLIGYTEEEIKEDPGLWRRTVHPDDRERVFAADAGSNIGGDDRFSMEYRMIHKDGRIVWVQDEARLVRTGDAPPYWQGFLLDITERKQAEEQLAHALEVEREATSRLRRLDEMKNTFLQAVSHDLRTPLAAILGLAITLERSDVDLDEQEARRLAGRIAENARRLDRLVTNLLDLDRLARGIVAPRLRPTEIGELVRSVIDGSGLIPHDRLRTNIESVTIPADGAKVERIVENLLANTARHTPERTTIWVSVRPQDEGALIAIEDDGPGVAAELRDTIFEPFQQGPDAPQHSPGVGVGLTLVRRFAELHGGRAWVEGRQGGGASFRVFLPRRPELTPEAVSEAAAEG